MNPIQSPGHLYIVATPIGNLADISLRALDILKGVNRIAAEDTRHSRHLCQHYGIETPLIALHEYNERAKASWLVQRLLAGESIALISDAGTPLISDPGYHLVQSVQEAGVTIVPIPGASALIAALSASGLATDRFQFMGFLPAKAGARQQSLASVKTYPHTLVFYESPHRLMPCLQAMVEVFGGGREVTLAKELTKSHETIFRASLLNVIAWLNDDSLRQKGEFVILVEGDSEHSCVIDQKTGDIMQILAQELSLKQAAKLTSKITGVKKNELYQWGLEQKDE